VAVFRGLADLIHGSLPRRVTADDVFLPWETTAATLLARIARQGETIAFLIEAGHELDAEMVVRSQLDHEILFAWLAITPQDTSRPWKARDPDQNTLWWMVSQYQRDKALTEDQELNVGGILDQQLRDALRAMKKRVNALPARGEFPAVRELAEEVDAHWGLRIDGFSSAPPRTPGLRRDPPLLAPTYAIGLPEALPRAGGDGGAGQRLPVDRGVPNGRGDRGR
jgi:hypothetical protein